MEGASPHPPGSFPSLPEEIQVHIILALDVPDILSCRLLCRQIRSVVDSASTIRYRIELAAAGMIERSSPGAPPTSECLQQLRAYEEAWRSAEMLFRPCLGRLNHAELDLQPWWHPSGGIVLYIDVENSTLNLLRPPSLSRGIPERLWTFNVRDLPMESVGVIAVDLKQDLMVITQTPEDGTAKCHFLSISQNGAPHPLATRVLLYSLDVTSLEEQADTVNIRGDLVSWDLTFARTGGPKQEFRIWNWKTGVLVWYYRSSRETLFYPLDSTLILAVPAGAHYTASLFEFDPSVAATAQDPVPMDGVAPLCRLEFPPLRPGVATSTSCCSGVVPPATYPDCHPLFSLDPALCLVALMFSLRHTASDKEASGQQTESRECLLVMIPVSTLKGVALRCRQRYATTDGSAPVIPWNDWGVDGARCCRFNRGPSWLSVTGSKCILHFPGPRNESDDGSDRLSDVLILDARPWIHLSHVPSSTPSGKFKLQGLIKLFCDAEHRTAGADSKGPFSEPVVSTYPCRVIHRELPGRVFGVDDSLHAALTMHTEDSLAFVFEQDPTDTSYPINARPAGFYLLHT